MAPKVQVPADFGKHHIGAVSHGNLIFKLKDGAKVKANSIILSLNSPVIDHLTTNLDQQTLDADDFQKDAVDCFIEAAYTGELENINQSNFRDVNKMSWVFDVSWLTKRCAEYFEMLVSQMQEKEYDEILFVVEEARFFRDALKKRTFLELVIDKLACLVEKRNTFIEKYMEKFIELTEKQLDCAIEIIGDDVHVIVQILTSHLENHKEGFDKNTRYLIENIDLSMCLENNSDKYDALFNAIDCIENISKEDFKMLLNVCKGKTPRNTFVSTASTKIPNLFHSFEKYIMTLSFEDTFNNLAASDEVQSLYMFFDGLWVWFSQIGDSRYHIEKSQNVLKRVIELKEARNWGAMPYEYLDRIYEDCWGNYFANLVKDCNQLVSRDTHYSVSSIQKYSRQDFIDLIFLNRSQIKFKLDNAMTENCENEGNCGIVLQTNSPSRKEPNKFDIRLVTDPNECPQDIHLHNDLVLAKNMHIAIEIPQEGKQVLCPLSWCGKPFYDDNKQCWGWGYIQLEPTDDEDESTWLIGRGSDLRWRCMTEDLLDEDCKIGFTLFYNLEK